MGVTVTHNIMGLETQKTGTFGRQGCRWLGNGKVDLTETMWAGIIWL
jgi:hypothetical protein